MTTLWSDVHCCDWLLSTPDWDQSRAVWSQSLVSAKDWSKKWNGTMQQETHINKQTCLCKSMLNTVIARL